MSFAAILLLAFGLAMDATAVAAARGLAAGRAGLRQVLLVALLFGGAQALMPLAGWWLGAWMGPTVAALDHWIAFGLLAGIGGKMVWEGLRAPDGQGAAGAGSDVFALPTLLLLALATSIDAFAAGITLPLLGAPLALSLATIGLTTAALSGAGVVLGRRFGARLGRRLDALGGVVLVGLGCKILVQHLGHR